MKTAAKTAVVTGAGSGVGRAVALTLLKHGYRVALAGRRRDMLEETAAMASPKADGHGHALCIPTDVADAASIAALFAEVEREFGGLGVLFNNAGRGAPPVEFDEIDPAIWMEVVATNLTGSFLCAQHAFRLMRHQQPQGGRIINNGSISAHAPRPFSAPYTSTKHAITGLTKSISLDGRRYDIVASQVDIGNAATPMTERMAGGVPQPDGTKRPEPRMDAQHVADVVLSIANMPLDANILFTTVMANQMPFVGRG